jgi:hypothetical protein
MQKLEDLPCCDHNVLKKERILTVTFLTVTIFAVTKNYKKRILPGCQSETLMTKPAK